MPFEEGKPRPETSGRKAGTPNKRTWEARKLIEEMGFNPIEALVHFARGDWAALGYKTEQKEISIGDGKTLMVDRIDEQLRQKSTKDLMPYLFPQLKSMELTGDAGALAALSLTQLLANAVAAKGKPDAGSGDAEPGTNS